MQSNNLEQHDFKYACPYKSILTAKPASHVFSGSTEPQERQLANYVG